MFMPTMNNDARPPLINLVWKDVPNPTRTEAEGRKCFDNVLFVAVTSVGSKDVFEAVADDYVKNKKREALNGGQFKIEWVTQLEHEIARFKEGETVSRVGTPLSQCPLFNRAQVSEFAAIGITTQEDLAALPDSNLNVLGMGGREIRDKMKAYIQSGRDHGVVAEQVTRLEADNKTLQEQLKTMAEKVRELEAALPPKRGPGRPSHAEREAA